MYKRKSFYWCEKFECSFVQFYSSAFRLFIKIKVELVIHLKYVFLYSVLWDFYRNSLLMISSTHFHSSGRILAVGLPWLGSFIFIFTTFSLLSQLKLLVERLREFKLINCYYFSLSKIYLFLLSLHEYFCWKILLGLWNHLELFLAIVAAERTRKTHSLRWEV